MKEGGGGDNVAIAYRTDGSWPVTGDSPIPGSELATIDKTTGPVSIVTQPQSQTIQEGRPVTFGVTADGTPPYTYQWKKGGTDITDATNRTYSILLVATTDAGQYTVAVTGAQGAAVTSSPATLTVNVDTTPPTISSVGGGSSVSAPLSGVTVVFSERVDAVSAGTPGNYTISGGVTVSGVTVLNETTVALRTSTQTRNTPYTLTVSNVKDKAAAPNTIAANTLAQFTSAELTSGFVTWQMWNGGIGIGTLTNNLADGDFGRPPDRAFNTVRFESGRALGSDYGARGYTWFRAPANGDYVFYMTVDDNARLYLSTDDNPANKKNIAAEATWSDNRAWTAALTTEQASDSYVDTEWPTGNTITLAQNQLYYLEAQWQEGGGGDGVEVTYKLTADPDPVTGEVSKLTGSNIALYADPGAANVTITQPPQSATVPENSTASFSVTATGSSTLLFYQWQKAPATGSFTDIAGANGTTYTTGPLTVAADNGSRYRVTITVPGLITNSPAATVTVVTDNVAPTLAAARRNFADNTKVTVLFSELMQAASANAFANYTINNGITVSAAVLQADGKSVVLTTSAINKGTTNTLTVSAVRDLAGNQIAASAQIIIGFERGALLVTTDVGPLTFLGDQAVNQHLIDRGYYVELAQGALVPDDGSTALGKDIIIQTSTLGSGTVEIADPAGGAVNVSKFKLLTIPVVFWEASNLDAFGFTGANGTTTAQTDLNIVDANHPLAAGLSAGLHPVVTSSQTFSQIGPPPLAPTGGHIIATIGTGTDATICAYDTGERGFNDFVMPARRVFFFFQDNTAAAANADGWKLFDAAVDWAQNIAVAVAPRFAPPTVSGGNLQLSWTGSGTLQQTDSLTTPNWQSAPSQANPQSVPVGTTGSRYYRIAP